MAGREPSIPLEDTQVESFCQLYVFATSFDAIEACKMAYPDLKSDKDCKTKVKELWGKKDIRNRVKYITESRNDIQLVDKFWIMNKLKEIVETNDGRPQYQLKALELLGKAIDMFKENQKEEEKSGDPGVLAKDAFSMRKFEVFSQQKAGELNVAS